MTPTPHPQPRNTFLAAALALAVAPLCAQAPQRPVSTLPATSPTALPAANTLQAPIAATPDTTHPSHEPKRAEVTYAAGLINVRADNSSLNQILHSISRLTDMTITGGVADERVFGNYGPAEPSTILATLLGGTGSNMLLRISTTDEPSELILTPRNGGPTPPNPNAARFDDDQDVSPPRNRRVSDRLNQRFEQQAAPQQAVSQPAQQQPSGPPSIPQPANNVNGSPDNSSPTAASYPTTNSVPLDSVPTPSTTPSTSGIVDAPNPPPPGSTTSTSPNGVSTPDQIYQQLLQMQKQKSAPSSSTTTTPATTPQQ